MLQFFRLSSLALPTVCAFCASAVIDLSCANLFYLTSLAAELSTLAVVICSAFVDKIESLLPPSAVSYRLLVDVLPAFPYDPKKLKTLCVS